VCATGDKKQPRYSICRGREEIGFFPTLLEAKAGAQHDHDERQRTPSTFESKIESRAESEAPDGEPVATTTTAESTIAATTTALANVSGEAGREGDTTAATTDTVEPDRVELTDEDRKIIGAEQAGIVIDEYVNSAQGGARTVIAACKTLAPYARDYPHHRAFGRLERKLTELNEFIKPFMSPELSEGDIAPRDGEAPLPELPDAKDRCTMEVRRLVLETMHDVSQDEWPLLFSELQETFNDILQVAERRKAGAGGTEGRAR
jgi:hypothetical protein